MLCPEAKAYLDELSYQDDAPVKACYLPLSGIYWQDEIPDMTAFARLPGVALRDLLALFGIRTKIWRHDELTADELQFWAAARTEAPNCPIFRRLAASAEEMAADEQLKESGDEIFEALIADADSVEVENHENGVQAYSALFKVPAHNDNENDIPPDPDNTLPEPSDTANARPWWQRLFRRR